MSLIKLRGIIIKQSDFGEANRVLTIFTKEKGIIKASIYGAKSIKNKKSGLSQVLTYGDFMLNDTGKDLMTVQSIEPIECFFAVHEDIEKLSLCIYFTDVIYSLININSPDENMLKLLLNCIYALAYKENDLETVRAVFELRAISYAGFMPNLYTCTKCQGSDNIIAFSVKGGGIVCEGCAGMEDYPINADVYHAIKYILTAEEKKMLSFKASDDVMKKVSQIAENYVKNYAEKDFYSLEYYKKIKI